MPRGRPKGSRNKKHKRKYTKRNKVINITLHDHPVNGAAFEQARELALDLRARLTNAPNDVRRIAVMDLLADLHWMAKFWEHPAP